MSEEEAQDWITAQFGAARYEQLSDFVGLVIAENDRQNLIGPSTIATIWNRHIVDSAQLMSLAEPGSRWLDVGTGGGFPGMIAAALHDGPVVMAEPRRKRAEFLDSAVRRLGLETTAMVVAKKVEQVTEQADIITARAVATPENLLQATWHCATAKTRWVLPRGRTNVTGFPEGMVFHVKQSISDPESSILIVEQRAS